MKRLILAVAGAVLISACSDAGDRRTSVDDSLTRPLEVARVDTTRPLAPVEREVTRPNESVTMPKPRKAKRQPKQPAALSEATPPVATPLEDTAVSQEDTTVRGYAPDTGGTSAPDTVRTPAPDTVPSPAPDTAPTLARDTSAAPARDTAVGLAPDTVATRTPDTASTVASGSPTPSAAAASAARTLPIGTEIHAALDDSINSRTDSAGRVVTAVVMENVTGSDGTTLIAAGAPVRFTVTRLSAAKSKSAQGRLALQVDGISIGGELRKLSADVRPVPHELRGRGVGTNEAAKVGVGAAGGAVLGRVLGGNTKGAVIGGVVGAAGGAVVASQTASLDVVVKARTPVVFVLTQPLVAP
ncbi:MAG: hypothetical protein M3Q75_02830 [Gemmatimonadota bacterium]|nr:hypothetical protein [Gemmatimonadota bacterium]